MRIKKPILTAVTVCLAVALVVLTFLSRTIMTRNQAEVMHARPEKRNIITSRDVTGTVEYEDTYEARYGVAVEVLEVLVRPGDEVRAGQALLEVDAREFGLELRKLELAAQLLEETDNGSELWRMRLELAREEIALYRERHPTDGKVRARSAGTVYAVNAAPGMAMEPGASLVSVSGKSSAASVVFHLPEDDARFFDLGDSAILQYYNTFNLDGSDKAMEIAKNSSISGKQFILKDNLYRFSVPIQNDYVHHGQQVQCKITNRSPIYDNVVPYEALHEGEKGTYFVYALRKRDGLFGDEYRPETVNVKVLFENGANAAVSGLNISTYDDVVVWSSAFLLPGEPVRLLN